jgi:hypothetical protein
VRGPFRSTEKRIDDFPTQLCVGREEKFCVRVGLVVYRKSLEVFRRLAARAGDDRKASEMLDPGSCDHEDREGVEKTTCRS